MPEQAPAYDLAEIQALVRAGNWVPTGTAVCGAGELGLDRHDIEACVLALTNADFRKSMPAEKAEGLHQDVYKPRYCGHELYVKLQVQVAARAMTGSRAVVISFKRK